jgi:mono/diheme cytochrome c family protein
MRSHRLLLLTVLLAVFLSACTEEKTGAPPQDVGSTVAANPVEASAGSFEERMAKGRKLYSAHCAACHQANGQGLAGAFPPLAESDYLAAGPAVTINVILNGLTGTITVNGKDYNSVMPNLSYLSDSEVADIVTFVMNSWGNPGGEASAGEVAAARDG